MPFGGTKASRLRPLRRQGGDRRVHRAPLDHDPDRADALSVLSMTTTRTQVGIVGAGPAGLLLSHLLAREGIDSIVLEDQSRDYVENRIRAGVLEQGTVDLLDATGLGERMSAGGPDPRGHRDPLRRPRPSHRLPCADRRQGDHRLRPAGGGEGPDRRAARRRRGRSTSRSSDVTVHGIDGDAPRDPLPQGRRGARDRLRLHRRLRRLPRHLPAEHPGRRAHRSTSASIPSPGWASWPSRRRPPNELIYAHTSAASRSSRCARRRVSRLYLQCAPDDDIADWPDDAHLGGTAARGRRTATAAFRIPEGPVLQKGITPMRSFVAEPMQYGRLYLAGDAAHIVPPTGAKGMNLAVADVRTPDRGARRLLPHGRRGRCSPAIRRAACGGSGRRSASPGG